MLKYEGFLFHIPPPPKKMSIYVISFLLSFNSIL